MSTRWDHVQSSIAKRAATLGNKSANLQELKEICESLNIPASTLRVQVPDICPLSHQDIYDHLTLHAPHWKKAWESFVELQKKEHDITPQALNILNELKSLIIKTFQEHPFSSKALDEYITKQTKEHGHIQLMVRSTGQEDTLNLANPGGNESVAGLEPNAKSMAVGMGIVVASYFSEKSLKQRLLSKGQEGDITSPPFIPILIQRMIGEPQSALTKKTQDIKSTATSIPRSGVMYTSAHSTRIQVAPGLGELIVNSKGNFDAYYVSRQNVVYPRLSKKTFRLVAGTDGHVEKATNEKSLQEGSSIPREIAVHISNVGRSIEAHYGRPMDVEFVYSPIENTLYLVQARPIPDSARIIPPSSVPPEKLKNLEDIRKNEGLLENLYVVSPANSAAEVVTSKTEILICNNIETALKIYLSQQNSSIKAVIIQEEAPQTSHEAAQFNLMGIPVMQVDNIKVVEEWMNVPNPVVIVDPQRKQLIQWTSKIKDHSNAAKELFDEHLGILKVGQFESPIPAGISFMPLFEKTNIAEMQKKMLSIAPSEKIKMNRNEANLERIGNLILQANNEDKTISERAFKELLPILYSLLPEAAWKKSADEKLAQELLKNLHALKNATAGQENHEALNALSQILVGFYRLGKSFLDSEAGSSHRKLFQQAMITGAEIYLNLRRLSQNKQKMGEPYDNKELLNLIGIMDALINEPGTQKLMSLSIRQIAQNIKASESALKIPGSEKLDKEQQKFLNELVKLQSHALNQRYAEQWGRFCVYCCQNEKRTQLLTNLVNFAISNGIESDWLNRSFARHYNQIILQKRKTTQTKQAVEDTQLHEVLKSMADEAQSTIKELGALNLNEKNQIIAAWEQRISEWNDPRKFEQLWQSFEKEFVPLIDELTLRPNMKPLSKTALLKTVQNLTEVLDRTIKAMKGSPLYAKDHALLIERFVRLLTVYHRLMVKWVDYIPEDQFTKWSKLVDEGAKTNSKANILETITGTFEGLKKQRDEAQLNASPSFSVASVRIGSAASFARQFNSASIRLEDLFTLFHQNIIASTRILGQNLNEVLPNLPEQLKPFVDSILSIRKTWTAVELININHQYPKLILEFNYPLRNHSAMFNVEYDQKTGRVTLHAKLFGHNKHGRMDFIVRMAGLEARLMNAHIVKRPNYDTNSQTLDFSWQFTSDQLKTVSSVLNETLESYAVCTLPGLNEGKAWSELLKRHSKEIGQFFLSHDTKTVLAFINECRININQDKLVSENRDLISYLIDNNKIELANAIIQLPNYQLPFEREAQTYLSSISDKLSAETIAKLETLGIYKGDQSDNTRFTA